MFCNKCGKEINNTEKFCPFCGAPTGNSSNSSNNTVGNQRQSTYVRKSNISKKKIIIGVVVGVLVLIVLGWLFGDDDTDTGITKGNSRVINYNLTVVNHTGIDICGLYASEATVDNWQEDLLGDDILYNGASVNITFTMPANDFVWDYAIEDSNGKLYEYYNLSFENCDSNGAVLTFDSDGYATLN